MIASELEMVKLAFERALPRLEQQGRFYFRRLKPEAKEEAMEEMRGLAWKYWLQSIENGRDPAAFVSVIGERAAKHVKDGRKVAGAESVRSISNPKAQQRLGSIRYRLEPDLALNEVTAAVGSSRKASPADQAQFNLDTKAWAKRLPKKKQEMLVDMAKQETTKDLAAKYKVTPGRISQIRREMEDDYLAFHDELSR